ncbi:MAG: hypothetical protein ACI4CT_01825 [Lachnospiraceae bacterium]
MTVKKWCCAILVVVGLTFFGIGMSNYYIDPFGYFTFRSGNYDDIDFPADTTYYQRFLKIKHVQKFHAQYDAYLIGGSKAGSFLPETLQELDGYRYYNMYEIGGNFYEYEQTVNYLLEHASPKKIVLSISGGEVRFYRRDSTDLTYEFPAVMTGEPEWKEYLKFLFLDPHKSMDRWTERQMGEQVSELQPDGSRNLQKYYENRERNPKRFTKKHVTKPLAQHLERLFTTNSERKYYQDCLDSLKRIKAMCENADVELLVMVAPSFIGEMSEHDTTYYRDYLLNMATITDYWDFSGYHDINLNPYNFYNEGHFYYEVGDLMIRTIAGKDAYPGFGTYVTRYNVAQHIAERTSDYERLKEEYEKDGSVPLPGEDSPSNLIVGESLVF